MYLKKISKIARNMGIITIWDFAHSIGALPLSVKKDDIDFEVVFEYSYIKPSIMKNFLNFIILKNIN